MSDSSGLEYIYSIEEEPVGCPRKRILGIIYFTYDRPSSPDGEGLRMVDFLRVRPLKDGSRRRTD